MVRCGAANARNRRIRDPTDSIPLRENQYTILSVASRGAPRTIPGEWGSFAFSRCTLGFACERLAGFLGCFVPRGVPWPALVNLASCAPLECTLLVKPDPQPPFSFCSSWAAVALARLRGRSACSAMPCWQSAALDSGAPSCCSASWFEDLRRPSSKRRRPRVLPWSRACRLAPESHCAPNGMRK